MRCRNFDTPRNLCFETAEIGLEGQNLHSYLRFLDQENIQAEDGLPLEGQSLHYWGPLEKVSMLDVALGKDSWDSHAAGGLVVV